MTRQPIPIKVAVVTLNSTPDYEKNIDAAFKALASCSEMGVDLVVLPEMFSYMGPYGKLAEIAKRQVADELIERLSKRCGELHIGLVAGSIPEPMDSISGSTEGKVYNTCFVFDRDGRQLGKYRKIHLFKVEPIEGQPRYDETLGFVPGNELLSINFHGWSLAIVICFDLRFSAIFQKLAHKGWPDLIAIPSAFTAKTGRDHWHTLLSSRAIEWQCYIAAANQAGHHYNGKESFGHSAIIDPWGKQLAGTNGEPGIAAATITHQNLKQIREAIPMRTSMVTF